MRNGRIEGLCALFGSAVGLIIEHKRPEAVLYAGFGAAVGAYTYNWVIERLQNVRLQEQSQPASAPKPVQN